MKTIMQGTIIKFYFLTICVLHTTSFINGEPNLEIFKNVSSDVTKVTSNVIEIPSGANVALICKVVPFENEKVAKTYWFKVPKSSKSALNVTTDLKNGATLRLDNLSLEDEGQYACVSFKQGLIKVVHLIVTNDNIRNRSKITKSNELYFKRVKRYREFINRTEFDNWVKKYDDDFDIDAYRASNLPTLQDTLDESQRLIDMINKQREEDEERRRRLEYSNNDDYYNTNDSRDDGPSSLKPVLMLFACLFCAIMVWVIIRCCGGYDKDNLNLARTNNTVESTQPFSSYSSHRNQCGHASCPRNYLLNPSGVCRYQDDSSAPADPLLETPRNNMPITPVINRSRLGGNLDLPPNYNTSVHSSRHSLQEPTDRVDGLSTKVADAFESKEAGLPPSYAEALAHDDHQDNGHTNDRGSSSYNHPSSHGYCSNTGYNYASSNGYSGSNNNYLSTHVYDNNERNHSNAYGHTSNNCGGGSGNSRGVDGSSSRGDGPNN